MNIDWIKVYAKIDEVKDSGGIITRRPAAWTGEGLPPVGTVCENVFPGEFWREVIIIAHDCDIAIFRLNNDERLNYFGDTAQHFRPIRTAEQIAAEELQAEVESALRAIDSVLRFPPNSASGNIVGSTVRAMLEVGYHKQEQK